MFRFSSKKDKKNVSWFKGQGSVNLLLDENIGLMKIQKPDVKVNNDSQGKVVLNWNSIAEADTFEVHVSVAKDGPYKLLKSTMHKRLTHSSANRGENPISTRCELAIPFILNLNRTLAKQY